MEKYRVKNLKNVFSYSIAEEIMPDLAHLGRKDSPDKFALILKTGASLSIPDICDIKTRTGLSPLFFEISQASNTELSRAYARRLGAPITKAFTRCNFATTLKECSFSISEDVTGFFLSFLSHTPTYVDAGCSEIRSLIGEMIKFDIPHGIIIPYTKNRTKIIDRTISSHADFCDAIKKIRADIGADFKKLFY